MKKVQVYIETSVWSFALAEDVPESRADYDETPWKQDVGQGPPVAWKGVQDRQGKTAGQANGGDWGTGPKAGPAFGSDAQDRRQSPVESGRIAELPKA